MFNLTEVQSGFDVVPEGRYAAKVTKVEFKTSKAGSEYLNLTFTTDKGNVYQILNINHPSEQPRNIALAELKRIITNGTQLSDLNFKSKEQLADALYLVNCDIAIKHKVDDYGTKATIKGYFPLSDASKAASGSEIPF